ncbi:MAG: peptidylprolyl isomerase [Lachnospiraceae bacterium]|nr:peptidylprolyl isomerase [Lachnospiraceae bacterium]
MLLKIKKIVFPLLLVVLFAFTAAACGNSKVVLTAGLGKNEIFRVGTESASAAEFGLYLAAIAWDYESIYGSEFWSIDTGEGTTMLDNCKDLALAQLARLKVMKLLAQEYSLTLNEEEEALVVLAAEQFMDSLSEEALEALGLGEDGSEVLELYEEQLLSDKLYAYLIKDVNPEISDDEARIVTVQHILLKTYTVDENGNRQEMSEEEKSRLYTKAEEIRELALEGESFESLIAKYSEDTKSTYSFGKGEMEESFENTAFELETDEISHVTVTSHGYHIIKCISTLDREATDQNKQALLLQRKAEAFGETYNEFVSDMEPELNEDVLEAFELVDFDVTGEILFLDIYEEVTADYEPTFES